MNTRNKNFTQIILGVLTAFVLWGIGILLSGRVASGDSIKLYNTGALIIFFPFIFLASSILVAKYSVSKQKSTYYKTSIVCFILPFVGWIICSLLNFIAQATSPVFSYIANWIALIFTVPLASIVQQLLSLLPTSTDGMALILISLAYFVPMLIGILISLKIFKKDIKN